MTTADYIEMHVGGMKMLSKYGIRMDDYKYVDLYKDYALMVKNGNKVSYAVAYLADKYSMSEASVYRILRRFKAAIGK